MDTTSTGPDVMWGQVETYLEQVTGKEWERAVDESGNVIIEGYDKSGAEMSITTLDGEFVAFRFHLIDGDDVIAVSKHINEVVAEVVNRDGHPKVLTNDEAVRINKVLREFSDADWWFMSGYAFARRTMDPGAVDGIGYAPSQDATFSIDNISDGMKIDIESWFITLVVEHRGMAYQMEESELAGFWDEFVSSNGHRVVKEEVAGA